MHRYSQVSDSDESFSKEDLLEHDGTHVVGKRSIFARWRTFIIAHALLAAFYLSTIAYLLNAVHSCNEHGPQVLESMAVLRTIERSLSKSDTVSRSSMESTTLAEAVIRVRREEARSAAIYWTAERRGRSSMAQSIERYV